MSILAEAVQEETRDAAGQHMPEAAIAIETIVTEKPASEHSCEPALNLTVAAGRSRSALWLRCSSFLSRQDGSPRGFEPGLYVTAILQGAHSPAVNGSLHQLPKRGSVSAPRL